MPITDRLIINAAITGMVSDKNKNPHIPITVDEVVEDAYRCWNAGASIVHVHAWDEKEGPTYRGDIYQAIFQGIRAKCPGLLISGSTSGRLYPELEKRAQVLGSGNNLRPDFGSLTLGSLNFPTGTSINQPETIAGLATRMRDLGILPELEIFDFGMVDYANHLIRKEILSPPYYGNLLLGSLGTLSASSFNLATLVQSLPKDMTWSATGIGRFQFHINAMAITMGGHVRVGLEDNLWYDAERTQLATNVGLIERLVKLAHAAGREIADPAETRALIGLPA